MKKRPGLHRIADDAARAHLVAGARQVLGGLDRGGRGAAADAAALGDGQHPWLTR
ncbi:MAG: hypothetical protein IPG56_05230 [Caulobacteraceae bacterium]|nr:hypothetical protein [Caulobacteraceae bacterium]